VRTRLLVSTDLVLTPSNSSRRPSIWTASRLARADRASEGARFAWSHRFYSVLG